MDSMKQPSRETLKKIENWEIRDAHELINYLREQWAWKSLFVERWEPGGRHGGRSILRLELHTGGWSGAEEMIRALEKNFFWNLWWSKTERGGRYTFKIDFFQIGFVPVSEFVKEMGFTRQYAYKAKEKFDWIEISHAKRLIRQKRV